jgi:hypothetical protein
MVNTVLETTCYAAIGLFLLLWFLFKKAMLYVALPAAIVFIICFGWALGSVGGLMVGLL